MRGSAELGRTISERRCESRLTQAELGEATGLDQPVVSLIERGRRGVSVFELARISDALGVTIDSLLPREQTTFTMRAGQANDQEQQLTEARCLEIIEDFLMLETATQ